MSSIPQATERSFIKSQSNPKKSSSVFNSSCNPVWGDGPAKSLQSSGLGSALEEAICVNNSGDDVAADELRNSVYEPSGRYGDKSVSRDEWLGEIAKWLKVLIDPDSWVELRALKIPGEGTKAGIFEGSMIDEMAAAALQLGERAPGVYWTLNPIRQDGAKECTNEVGIVGAGAATADEHIESRRLLLIDLDPQREGNCSSTDSEKELAFQMASAIGQHLEEASWPKPVMADSGNGYHLLYRIDLPAEDGGLVKNVLRALQAKFGDSKVNVDTKVDNPSRIVKFYGTMSRKGVHTAERPHRWSRVLSLPDEFIAVTREQLETLAAEVPVEKAPIRKTPKLPGKAAYSIAREEKMLRAKAYLAKMPPAIEGENGSGQAFHAACVAIEGFDLSEDDGLEVLQDWNTTCVPPWSERELRHKLQDADKKATDRGHLLVQAPATPSVSSSTKKRGANLERPDPSKLADAILDRRFTIAEGTILRYWRSEWWGWKDGAYEIIADGEMSALLWKELEIELQPGVAASGLGGFDPKPQFVSNNLVANVTSALKARTFLPNAIEAPVWIDGETVSKRNYLAFPNGLIDLNEVLAGKPATLLPASPKWFSQVVFPYDFDPTADCPKWKAFLQTNLEGDQERIDLLQEWFGYCLTPDTSHQKFLMLEGEGSNGKSVVNAALTAVLGERNVSHLPFEQFGNRFSLNATRGKLANVVSEISELGKSDEGILKSFVTGDRLTIDRKNKDAIEITPTARLVFATNTRPRLLDRSNGLWRRLILFPMRVQIGAAQRVPGMDKGQWWRDQGELPGVLNWALQGQIRLIACGEFKIPAICDEAIREYQIECNPARAFLTEACQADPQDQVPASDLYDAYRDWCLRNGHHPLAQSSFGKEVIKVFPKVKKDKLGRRDARVNWYQGIGMVKSTSQTYASATLTQRPSALMAQAVAASGTPQQASASGEQLSLAV